MIFPPKLVTACHSPEGEEEKINFKTEKIPVSEKHVYFPRFSGSFILTFLSIARDIPFLPRWVLKRYNLSIYLIRFKDLSPSSLNQHFTFLINKILLNFLPSIKASLHKHRTV